MPPRIPFPVGFPVGIKPTAPFIRAISSSAPTKTPRANTASSLLSLDDPPSPRHSSPHHARTRSSTDEIQRLIARTDERYSRIKSQRADIQKRAEAQRRGEEYMSQMHRRWREGDVFTPHDLSPSEMGKWRRRPARTEDVLDVIGINPLDHYRNFSMISDFTTAMGHIQHSSRTGLRLVNQRKVAKAVRRVMGMGIHPSVHRHPELLQMEWRSKRSRP